MNMPFPSREQVEFIRKNYPPGTRVMLNNIRLLPSWRCPALIRIRSISVPERGHCWEWNWMPPTAVTAAEETTLRTKAALEEKPVILQISWGYG